MTGCTRNPPYEQLLVGMGAGAVLSLSVWYTALVVLSSAGPGSRRHCQ